MRLPIAHSPTARSPTLRSPAVRSPAVRSPAVRSPAGNDIGRDEPSIGHGYWRRALKSRLVLIVSLALGAFVPALLFQGYHDVIPGYYWWSSFEPCSPRINGSLSRASPERPVFVSLGKELQPVRDGLAAAFAPEPAADVGLFLELSGTYGEPAGDAAAHLFPEVDETLAARARLATNLTLSWKRFLDVRANAMDRMIKEAERFAAYTEYKLGQVAAHDGPGTTAQAKRVVTSGSDSSQAALARSDPTNATGYYEYVRDRLRRSIDSYRRPLRNETGAALGLAAHRWLAAAASDLRRAGRRADAVDEVLRDLLDLDGRSAALFRPGTDEKVVRRRRSLLDAVAEPFGRSTGGLRALRDTLAELTTLAVYYPVQCGGVDVTDRVLFAEDAKSVARLATDMVGRELAGLRQQQMVQKEQAAKLVVGAGGKQQQQRQQQQQQQPHPVEAWLEAECGRTSCYSLRWWPGWFGRLFGADRKLAGTKVALWTRVLRPAEFWAQMDVLEELCCRKLSD